MQSATYKKSTDTLYEIKAPLASFDTIDLEDFDIGHDPYSVHSLKAPSPEKCASELSESHEKECTEEINDPKEVEVSTDISSHSEPFNDEPGTPTRTETFEDNFDTGWTATSKDKLKNDVLDISAINAAFADSFNLDSKNDSDIEASDMTESGNITPTQASTCSKDANSSENNASAEDIQIKLKEKARKQKETVSYVKYQQIGSLSDVSDQEKESPVPMVKKKLQNRDCNSDSESTDSDSGYTHRGFISANKVALKKGSKTPDGNKAFNIISDFVDSADSTPYTSPKPRRPTVPPPLSKEESAIISKRKAYEKRLQRLQVTTNPIERPRSTTPINIYGLEEYVNISSPEKSSANCQKLTIKLPLDEGSKGKSPRRSAKLTALRSSESGEPHVFTFNEDLLFTHTKSAILLEDNISKGYSPKRVLVPPTLSPKVSPRNMPANSVEVQSSAKYMFYPWERSPGETNSTKQINTNNSCTADSENWAIFDDSKEKQSNDSIDTNNSEKVTTDTNNSAEGVTDNVTESDSTVLNHSIDSETFLNEEILTVHIGEIGDSRTCDISCEQVVLKSTEHNDVSKSEEDNKGAVNNELVLNTDNSLNTEFPVAETEEDLGTPV